MQSIVKLLKKSKKIALFTHKTPDPDTIGSTLALFYSLRKIGKDVSVFCDEDNLDSYAFLEGVNEFNKDELSGFDLYVSVDVASPGLLGKFETPFCEFSERIKIDHHSSGDNFAKHSLVKTYSACAIVIFELLRALKVKITDQIATCLYFGICGDTGIFRNTNTDSKTFEVCSHLLECGADIKKVYSEFFEKRTLANLYLSSNAIMGALVDESDKFVIMTVSIDDYEKFGASFSEPIGNLPNSFLNCGYKIAVILKQKNDGIHCSLRSKSEYDVSKIAEKFGGGGHKNASGCLIIDSLSSAERLLKEAIKNYLRENNKWKQISKLHRSQNFCQWKRLR